MVPSRGAWPGDRQMHERGARRTAQEWPCLPFYLLPPPRISRVHRAAHVNPRLFSQITCRKYDVPHTPSIAFLLPDGLGA